MPARVISRTTSSANVPRNYYIKLVLDAEKRGKQRIEQAREYQVKRFRQAKIEAEEDIRRYREQKDKKITQKLRQIQEDIQQEQLSLEKQIEEELQFYASRVNEVKHLVIAELINRVVDIQPGVHHNFEVRQQIARTGTYTRYYDPLSGVFSYKTSAER